MPSFSEGFMLGQAMQENRRQNRRNMEDHERKQFENARSDRELQYTQLGDELAAHMMRTGGKGGIETLPSESLPRFANAAKGIATGFKEDGTHVTNVRFDDFGRAVFEVGGKRPDGTSIKKGAPMSKGGGTDDDPIVFEKGELEQILLPFLAARSPALKGVVGELGKRDAFAQALDPEEEGAATAPQSAQATSSPGAMGTAAPAAPVASGLSGQGPSVPVTSAAPAFTPKGGGPGITFADFDPEEPGMASGLRAIKALNAGPEETRYLIGVAGVESSYGRVLETQDPKKNTASGPFAITEPTFKAHNARGYEGELDFTNLEHKSLLGVRNFMEEYKNYEGAPERALAAHYIGSPTVNRLVREGGTEALMAYRPDAEQPTVGEYVSKVESLMPPVEEEVNAAVEPPQGAAPDSLETIGQRARDRAGPVQNAVAAVAPYLMPGKVAQKVFQKVFVKGVHEPLVAMDRAMREGPSAGVRVLQDAFKSPNRLISKAAKDPANTLDQWIAGRKEMDQLGSEVMYDADSIDREMLIHAANKRDAAIKAGDKGGAAKYDGALNDMSKSIARLTQPAKRGGIPENAKTGPETVAAAQKAADDLKQTMIDSGVQKSGAQLEADVAVMRNAREGKRRTRRQLDAGIWLAATGVITPEQLERFVAGGTLSKPEIEGFELDKDYYTQNPDGSLSLVRAADPQMKAARISYLLGNPGKMTKAQEDAKKKLDRESTVESRYHRDTLLKVFEDFIKANKDEPWIKKGNITATGLFASMQEELRGPNGWLAAASGYIRTEGGQPTRENTDPGDMLIVQNAYLEHLKKQGLYNNRSAWKKYVTDTDNTGPSPEWAAGLSKRPTPGEAVPAEGTVTFRGQSYSLDNAVAELMQHPEVIKQGLTQEQVRDMVISDYEQDQAAGQ